MRMWISLENEKLIMCPFCGHVTYTGQDDKAIIHPAEFNYCSHCGRKVVDDNESIR